MTRLLRWVLLLLMAPALGGTSEGYDATPTPSLTGFPVAALLAAYPQRSLIDGIGLRTIKFTPSLRLGYQRMGMNLVVPIPFELSSGGAEKYAGDSAALKLPDVDVWVGEAGVDAQITGALRLYLAGAGNVIQAVSSTMPGLGNADLKNSAWRQHPLQWGQLEGGIVYGPWGYISAVAGLRFDRFDLRVTEPSGLTKINVGPYKNFSLLAGDVLSELWIPYLGFELAGKSYRASLIASPMVSAKVKARTRLKADVAPSHNFLGESVITLRSPATFVEARLEYKIEIASRFRLSLWSKAGWLASAGGGRLESSYSTTAPNLNVAVLEDRNVNFNRYNLAGGLALDASF